MTAPDLATILGYTSAELEAWLWSDRGLAVMGFDSRFRALALLGSRAPYTFEHRRTRRTRDAAKDALAACAGYIRGVLSAPTGPGPVVSGEFGTKPRTITVDGVPLRFFALTDLTMHLVGPRGAHSTMMQSVALAPLWLHTYGTARSCRARLLRQGPDGVFTTENVGGKS